jgi:hypothetical protein
MVSVMHIGYDTICFYLYCLVLCCQEIAEAGMVPHILAEANHRNIPTNALLATAITNFCFLSVFALLFGICK